MGSQFMLCMSSAAKVAANVNILIVSRWVHSIKLAQAMFTAAVKALNKYVA